MHVEMGRFLDLADADFEAYAADRTRATVMTGPRGSVKRRFLAWTRTVAAALGEEGIDLDVSATDEHPTTRNGHHVDAQSAHLFRGEDARRTMELALGTRAPGEGADGVGHARIELRIDTTAVSLVLRLGGDARVDLENAAWVLAHDDLTATWGAEPPIYIEARASLSPRAQPMRDVSPLEAAVMAKQALESEVPLVMGLRVSRAEATRPHALDAWWDVAVALGRLLKQLAWSPESALRASERPSRRGKRGLRAPKANKHEAKAADAPASPPILARGTHVRALAGPFAGQAGVVQQLDGKGAARVLFGLLAARVELRDLTLHSSKRGGRPVMSSSHRKPST
jgi:hypothetical protein